MFRIVRDFSKKKVYNYLKELSHKESNALIIFENYNEECNKFIDFMRNKYGNIKIQVAFIGQQLKRIVNVIDPSKINAQNLKSRYDLVCIIPFVLDGYSANKDFFGLPISIEKTINFQDDLASYYGLNKFVVFILKDEISYKKAARIIDLLSIDKNINSVLLGNSIICAEIHNLSMSNPVIIYNNNFLSEQFIKKAFKVFEGVQIEDEQFILESIMENQ